MSREPKYKLNKKDSARYRELLLRHCLEAPIKTKQQIKLSLKYPALTKQENLEFAVLCEKRSRKNQARPKVKEEIRHSLKLLKEAERAMAVLDAIYHNFS